MEINFAKATPAQLAEAGFTFKKMPSNIKRGRKSLFGVKPTANKKGIEKSTIANAKEEGNGTVRG